MSLTRLCSFVASKVRRRRSSAGVTSTDGPGSSDTIRTSVVAGSDDFDVLAALGDLAAFFGILLEGLFTIGDGEP